MQGASPLASPAFNRLRHLQTFSNMNPAGAYPVGRRLTLPPLYPAGGVLSLSPACPAFSLLPCPLSPRPPSPAGKGVTKVISCKGLRPLHPQHLTACGTYSPCHTGTPTRWRAFLQRGFPTPNGNQRSCKARNPPPPGIAYVRQARAARVQPSGMQGAKPLA